MCLLPDLVQSMAGLVPFKDTKMLGRTSSCLLQGVMGLDENSDV